MLALLPENIESFIEDRAPASPPHHAAESCLSFPVVSVQAVLTDGRGGEDIGGGRGDKSYDREKAWSSKNH
jgi:hypothetical protein